MCLAKLRIDIGHFTVDRSSQAARCGGSASPVLKATGFVNGKCQYLTPQNRYTSTDHQEIVTGDYVGDPYSYAKLGAHKSTGGGLLCTWVKYNQNYFIYTIF